MGKNNVKYEVSYCDENADINPRREWFRIAYKKTKSEAIKLAKKSSLKYFETYIIGTDANEDVILHHFYRKGEFYCSTLG